MTDVHERQAYLRPQTPARLGLAVIVLFAGTISAWSAFAPLSDAAIAEGSLQVEGRRQSVQHPYGGVIQSLHVEEGETVSKGEVLAVLSGTELRSERDVLLVEKASLLAQRARLLAEREEWDEPRFSEELMALDHAAAREAMENARRILATSNRQHQAAIDVLEAQIQQFRETIAGAQAEAKGFERQAGLIDEELQGARKLLKQGYTTRPRVLALERQASQLKASAGAKRSEIATAEQSIAEAEREIAQLEEERLASLAQELRQVETGLSEVRPKLEAAEDAVQRTEIKAPASGHVVGLSVFTEGGVIEAGAPLMDIVPAANPFFVQARLRPTDLRGVEVGQTADIELLSIPRGERPDLQGEVETVSADRLEDERTGEGYYSLQVRLNADDLEDAGVRLQAGMPVRVVMPIEARTLLGYLTSPLMDEVTTAFREP